MILIPKEGYVPASLLARPLSLIDDGYAREVEARSAAVRILYMYISEKEMRFKMWVER